MADSRRHQHKNRDQKDRFKVGSSFKKSQKNHEQERFRFSYLQSRKNKVEGQFFAPAHGPPEFFFLSLNIKDQTLGQSFKISESGLNDLQGPSKRPSLSSLRKVETRENSKKWGPSKNSVLRVDSKADKYPLEKTVVILFLNIFFNTK